MDLAHFSNDANLRFIDRQPRYRDGRRAGFPTSGKPTGGTVTWFSDEASNLGWMDYCADALGPEIGVYRYAIEIAADANVLRIHEPWEFLKFQGDYSVEVDREYMTGHREIEWTRFRADGYDGIVITPYFWTFRSEPQSWWYYGWDCASGFVFDPARHLIVGERTDTPKRLVKCETCGGDGQCRTCEGSGLVGEMGVDLRDCSVCDDGDGSCPDCRWGRRTVYADGYVPADVNQRSETI